MSVTRYSKGPCAGLIDDGTRVCSPLCLLASTVITGILFVGMAAPTSHEWTTHFKAALTTSSLARREALYLLPLLPAPNQHLTFFPGVQGISTEPGGAGPDIDANDGYLASGNGTTGRHHGRGSTAHQQKTDPVPNGANPKGGNVYISDEVDRVVQRDPASAAPAYPPDLEQLGVEGTAIVQYIVDTSGLADSASFVVDSTTHPEFAAAVRAALPGMKFQPAEIAGHHVRQSVRQEFKFVLPHPVDTTTHG